MTDYALARKHMIDSQIATMGVIDPALLDALGQVPRERFVPDAWRSAAYVDEDLALPGGFLLTEPMVFARMVQAAEVKSGDTVLCVGDDGGYAAAVLARLVAKVVVRAPQADRHAAALAPFGHHNIAFEQDGGPAVYEVILINGAVAVPPVDLAEKLAEGGRLVAVLREGGIAEGRALLMTRLHNGTISSRTLFDASTPFLAGHEPERVFTF